MQIMEGDLAVKLSKYAPQCGHVQVAGVPERNEPSTGEVHYPFLYKHLDAIGYSDGSDASTVGRQYESGFELVQRAKDQKSQRSKENRAMAKYRFIGLGIMGGPMCRNLLRAGHKVVVYNRSRGPIDLMVEFGAVRGESSCDVAERSNVVITMMPDGPEVEEAIIGRHGVLEGAKPGSTVIDMSSVNPLISQKNRRELCS